MRGMDLTRVNTRMRILRVEDESKAANRILRGFKAERQAGD